VDIERRLEVVESENRLLRERLATLEALLMETDMPVPVEWRLTGSEARVFGVLVNKPVATKEAILTALYWDRATDEEPDQKIIDVFVCKLRKKLAPFGVEIATLWGRGWTLHPDVREQFRPERKAA
jgi:two-component system, cell cycle response regulator CtrA